MFDVMPAHQLDDPLFGLLVDTLVRDGFVLHYSNRHFTRRGYASVGVLPRSESGGRWTFDDEIRLHATLDKFAGFARLVERADDGTPVVEIKLGVCKDHAKAK